MLALFCLVADGRTGSWLGGAGVILPILGLIVFAVGLFLRSDIDRSMLSGDYAQNGQLEHSNQLRLIHSIRRSSN